MDKIILFDLDRTIFNTNLLEEYAHLEISKKVKVDFDEVVKTRNKYLSTLVSTTDFNYFDFSKFIAKTYNIEKQLIEKILFNKNVYKNFVFKETIEVLSKLKKDYTLGVFSEGDLEIQMFKLVNGKLIDFFDKDFLFIKKRKLDDETLDELPMNSIIVDDKEKVIEKLFSTQKFKPIWINRKDEKKLQNIRTIKSLEELL